MPSDSVGADLDTARALQFRSVAKRAFKVVGRGCLRHRCGYGAGASIGRAVC